MLVYYSHSHFLDNVNQEPHLCGFFMTFLLYLIETDYLNETYKWNQSEFLHESKLKILE